MSDRHPVYALDAHAAGLIPLGGMASGAAGAKAAATRNGFAVLGPAVLRMVRIRTFALPRPGWIVPVSIGHPWSKHHKNIDYSIADVSPRSNPAASAVAPSTSATPPESVQRAFRQGLDLYARGLGGEGLRPETVQWARKLAKGDAITPAKARKMHAWFARHGASSREVEARLRQARELARGTLRGRAPALVAWLLWGGDPAVSWSRALVASGWAHEDVPLPRKRMVRGNPARLDRCAQSVERRLRRGDKSADPRETRSRAWAICTASLQRSGYLVPGTRTVATARKRASRRRHRRQKG